MTVAQEPLRVAHVAQLRRSLFEYTKGQERNELSGCKNRPVAEKRNIPRPGLKATKVKPWSLNPTAYLAFAMVIAALLGV